MIRNKISPEKKFNTIVDYRLMRPCQGAHGSNGKHDNTDTRT